MSENKDNRSSRYDDPMWKVVGALRVGAIVGDIDRRLTALERINDERMMRDSEAYDRDSALEPIERCKIVGCIVCGGPKDKVKHNCGENCHVHNPLPAPTVERFRVFEYRVYYWKEHYTRETIGEVVATRDNNGWWRLSFEPNKWSSVYSQEQYAWLVDMMLQSGAWERQV